MGLTLPVLLEDPLLTHQEFARTIGILYGFNTLGAVAGALLGETYLIRTCGLLGTGLTAGCMSCAAAGIAWLFSGAKPVITGQTPKRFRLRLSLGNRPPWSLLFVSMGAGAILFPLFLTCVQREVASRMNSAGLTILFNTTGAALGPLLACFVLLPWLGFQSSFILCAACYAGLAILASEKPTWSIRRPLGIALLALAAML